MRLHDPLPRRPGAPARARQALAALLGLLAGGALAADLTLSAPLPSLAQARASLDLPAGATLTLTQVPVGEARLTLRLQRQAADPKLAITVDDGQGPAVLAPAPRAHFSGQVEDEPATFAFATVDEDGQHQLIVHRDGRRHLLSLEPPGPARAARVQSREVDAPVDFAKRLFACHAEDPAVLREAASPTSTELHAQVQRALESGLPSSRAGRNTRRADVVVETDFAYFQRFGNATAAGNYARDLMAYVSALYQPEIGARLNVVDVRIYTTSADPWTAGTATGLLDQLRLRWNGAAFSGIARHHVHLLSAGVNNGGLAYLNTLNNRAFGYGVTSGIDANFNPANPQIVADALILAHEIGHAFGSDHTHNFDNPVVGSNAGGAIDCCSADTTSSQCGLRNGGAGRPGPLPGPNSLTGGSVGGRTGTIMSYCHLTPDGGGLGNVALNFGSNHGFGINPSRSAQVMIAAANSFLPLDATASFALTVSRAGSGGGTVGSNPAGIACGADCSEAYASGTVVTLGATPDAGSVFAGWSGACTGTGACTVTLSQARSVTATFNTAPPATELLGVSKAGSGGGTVSSSPAGIACGAGCTATSAAFPRGSTVTLSASADAGSSFAGWSGACSGTGVCSIALSETRAVTAFFNASASVGGSSFSRAGLAGAAGAEIRDQITVPAGARDLVITTGGGSGDVDLYVRLGSAPTTASFDCSSEGTTNAEVCSFPSPAAGTYQILLRGFSAFSGVTLQASFTPATPSVALSVSKLGSGQGTVRGSVLAAAAPEARIVGGSAAAFGAFPWQVALDIGGGQCGGAILSPRWVMTAAHCIDENGSNVAASSVRVRAGSLNYSSGGQQVGVSRIVKHPGYNRATFDQDLALLELATPLTLGPGVAAIRPLLPEQEASLGADGVLATATGWGSIASNGPSSEALLQVQLPLLGPASCRARSRYPAAEITDNMVCAGDLAAGGKDSCQGDSGGPLVVPDGAGGFVQAGIVSFGEGCGQAGFPGVYTRVANYRGFLESSTGLSFGTAGTAAPIDCGSLCSASFPAGTRVSLSATPAAGSQFAGWGGACSGTGACVVTLSQAQSVTATFTASATGGAGSASAQRLMQQVYIAYYGRPAEPGGRDFWAVELDRAGGSLAAVIQSFGNSAEFTSRYGGLGNEQLIRQLFVQLLNRQPDAGGLAFYLDELNAGRRSLQTIALDVLGGAVAGVDAQTAAQKTTAADYHTAKVRAGCAYGTVDQAVAYLAAVDSNPVNLAIAQASLDQRCGF